MRATRNSSSKQSDRTNRVLARDIARNMSIPSQNHPLLPLPDNDPLPNPNNINPLDQPLLPNAVPQANHDPLLNITPPDTIQVPDPPLDPIMAPSAHANTPNPNEQS